MNPSGCSAAVAVIELLVVNDARRLKVDYQIFRQRAFNVEVTGPQDQVRSKGADAFVRPR